MDTPEKISSSSSMIAAIAPVAAQLFLMLPACSVRVEGTTAADGPNFFAGCSALERPRGEEQSSSRPLKMLSSSSSSAMVAGPGGGGGCRRCIVPVPRSWPPTSSSAREGLAGRRSFLRSTFSPPPDDDVAGAASPLIDGAFPIFFSFLATAGGSGGCGSASKVDGAEISGETSGRQTVPLLLAPTPIASSSPSAARSSSSSSSSRFISASCTAELISLFCVDAYRLCHHDSRDSVPAGESTGALLPGGTVVAVVLDVGGG
mmetsp:Transcript_626/g.1429  ORF Transcript_626/g.1429 Transcript_626/m.1429 type:complete len:261 (-) Transcript_626:53-835(-)